MFTLLAEKRILNAVNNANFRFADFAQTYGGIKSIFFVYLARTTAYLTCSCCIFSTFLTINVHDRRARVEQDGEIGSAQEDGRSTEKYVFFQFNLFITSPEYENKIDIVDEYAHNTSYFYNTTFIVFRDVITFEKHSKSTGPTEKRDISNNVYLRGILFYLLIEQCNSLLCFLAF